MASIKEYNVKINSLKNTRKITKTMKMVSASKLRRAQEAQRNAHRYAVRLNELIARLSASVHSGAHPLLKSADPGKSAHIVVFSSDRGLCGGFNNGIIKYVTRWIQENKENYDSIDLSFCGRRGFAYLGKRFETRKHYEGVTPKPQFSVAGDIGMELCDLFTSGEYGEVYLAYNAFKSALSQEPTVRKILPIEPEEVEGGVPMSSDYIFEPEEKELLARLLPRSVFFKVYYTLLENSAGEHGARMTAMDNATKNASDLIDSNTLIRNRVRQAAITTELTEIVAGAEAL